MGPSLRNEQLIDACVNFGVTFGMSIGLCISLLNQEDRWTFLPYFRHVGYCQRAQISISKNHIDFATKIWTWNMSASAAYTTWPGKISLFYQCCNFSLIAKLSFRGFILIEAALTSG